MVCSDSRRKEMSEREVNFGNANAKGIMPSYVLWCVLLCVKAFRLSLSLSLSKEEEDSKNE